MTRRGAWGLHRGLRALSAGAPGSRGGGRDMPA